MRGRKTYPICTCCLNGVSLDCDVYACQTYECPDKGYSARVVEVTEEIAEKLRRGRRMHNSAINERHAEALRSLREEMAAESHKQLCEALGIKD